MNKEVLQPNMEEKTLISLCTICDLLHSIGGIQNFNFTPELFTSVRSARSRYRQYLEAKKPAKSSSEKRKSTALDEKELKVKRAKILGQIQSMEKDADSLSILAEVKSCFTTLAKANALRKGVNDKKHDLQLIEAQLQNLK